MRNAPHSQSVALRARHRSTHAHPPVPHRRAKRRGRPAAPARDRGHKACGFPADRAQQSATGLPFAPRLAADLSRSGHRAGWRSSTNPRPHRDRALSDHPWQPGVRRARARPRHLRIGLGFERRRRRPVWHDNRGIVVAIAKVIAVHEPLVPHLLGVPIAIILARGARLRDPCSNISGGGFRLLRGSSMRLRFSVEAETLRIATGRRSIP